MIDPLDTGDLDKDVARRLTLSRIASGKDPGVFAELADISGSNYSQFENLWRKLSLRAAMKICQAHGLTLDWLYRGDPNGLSIRTHDAIVTATKEHAPRIMTEIDAFANDPERTKQRSRRKASEPKSGKKPGRKAKQSARSRS